MKKMACLIVGLTTMATMALGQGQSNVFSANAVGYVKITANRGNLVLIRTDFLNISGSNDTMQSLIGDQVPLNSQAHIWDRDTDSYVTELRGGRAGDWPSNGREVAPGDAFWIEIPDSAPDASYDMFVMGEVPGDNNNSESNNIPGIDFDAIGFPYPVATNWGDTSLAIDAPLGSQVHFWDPTNQTYVSAIKGGRAGDWDAATKAKMIQPGEAFWLEVGAGTLDWDVTKPYNYP